MSPEDIDRIIEVLSERLGPSARYAFELALRQVYLNASIALVVGFLATMIGLWLFRTGWRMPPEEMYSGGMRRIEAVLGMASGVALAIIGPLVIVWWGVLPLLNPEWYALRSLGSLWPQ